MALNPDTQGNQATDELVPFLGMLRWLDYGDFKTLQQFQYSGSLNANDWYDVPTVLASVIVIEDNVVATVTDEELGLDIVSELTPPQTESEMLAAAKNAPRAVDRSPPYAT